MGGVLKRIDLNIKIGKLELKNPVMVASGTFGPEYGELLDISSLGAYVAKTITLNARTGNPPPRVFETASGMLNAIGLENKGVEYFVKNALPKLRRIKIPIIASIAGDDADEFEELASKLSKVKKISAIEVNLSCPNVKHGTRDRLIAQDANDTYDIIKSIRQVTPLTVIAKLSPNVTDIKVIAKAAESAGADAISLINTLIGMAVDIDSKRPVLGNVTGGLSGPAIKPIALRMVRDAHKAVKIPVIGIGGIMDHKDAIEFILCGASAVQVGTANFAQPKSVAKIIDGIKGYMAKNSVKTVKELVGALKI